MRRPTHAKTATPQQSPPPTQPPCQELDSRATDESLVFETVANGIRSGRPSLLLTRDRDLLEQFYKLCWLIDTHYRAMLIAR